MLIGHFSQGARPVSEKVPGAQGAADREMCVARYDKYVSVQTYDYAHASVSECHINMD